MTSGSSDPVPFLAVADGLRRKIATGELQEGQKLPTNSTLALEYGVAPMTLRRALEVLKGEGLITSHQGRGTFVASNDVSQPPREDTKRLADELRSVQDDLKGVSSRLAQLEKRLRHG